MNTQQSHNPYPGGLASSRHRTDSTTSLPHTSPITNIVPSPPPKRNDRDVPLPQHFLVRPSIFRYTASGTATAPGAIVPLIAVDQLPEGFNLLGVPRELSVDQTLGLTNLGTIAKEPECYQVYLSSTGTPAASATPSLATGSSSLSSFSSSPPESITGSPPASGVGPAAYPISAAINGGHINLPRSEPYPAPQIYPQLQSEASPHCHTVHHPAAPPRPTPTPAPPPPPSALPIHHAGDMHRSSHPPFSPSPSERSSIPPSRYNAVSPATLAPAPRPISNPNPNLGAPIRNNTSGNNNIFSKPCKYWCHFGRCSFGDRCKYTHMMPTDAQGLREVELEEPPKWWLDAVARAWGPRGGVKEVSGVSSSSVSLLRGGSQSRSQPQLNPEGKGVKYEAQKEKKAEETVKEKEKEAVVAKGKGKEPASPNQKKGTQAPNTAAAARQATGGKQVVAANRQKQAVVRTAPPVPASASAAALSLLEPLKPTPVPARTPAPEEFNLVDL